MSHMNENASAETTRAASGGDQWSISIQEDDSFFSSLSNKHGFIRLEYSCARPGDFPWACETGL